MSPRPAVRLALGLLGAVSPATAQSFNVDLGPNILFAPAPGPGYAGAAAQVGVWNAVPPSLAARPLVDLGGAATGVTLRSDSASSFTVFPSVMPPGDDQRLMEDFQITPNLNTRVTWTLEGLADGPYRLVVYASDPTNAALRTLVDVPASGGAPVAVGGGWPGAHGPGATFAEFHAGVVGGRLEFLAEVVGGPLDSGVVNGFQLTLLMVPPLGFVYCASTPNSTGVTATIAASGSAMAAADLLRLEALGLPPGAFAFVLASRAQGFVPQPGGSQGNLCLGGAVGRLDALVGPADAAGAYVVCTQGCPPGRTFSLTALPQPGGPVAVQPGETWSFQAWFRDAGPGGQASSNFSDGYQLTFQ